ncbi:MAG: helicase, partial [Anaerolineae bacterium]|nr:helicase [Anaerolineae bacterium]
MELGEGGQKTKYRRNVDAIKLLNTLESEGRNATADEQRTLALYVGWGSLPQVFDETNEKWAKEHAELKALLTPAEYETAEQSTQYAHFTERSIIGGIYSALKHLGFTGGKMLEAGGGVGNFIGLMPADLRTSSRYTLVERERISAGIAKHLYPRQNVQMADFRAFGRGDDGYYDVAAGNPPFGNVALTDLTGRKHLSGLTLHNYFIAKQIDMLRDGGILINVVSNYFLDAAGDRARKYIGERAKLLGAIRLPNNAFKGNAGTEVTTDIVIFQKLPESEWGSRAASDDAKRWIGLTNMPSSNGGEPIPTNTYFAQNPHMMLGDWGRHGSMYAADSPALVAKPGQKLADALQAAVAKLPQGVFEAVASKR